MDEVQRQPFMAVVGASGSGKSSVVRAGLVPKLRRDRDTIWETVILVPTDQPLKALAKALLPLLEPSMSEVDRLAEATKLAEHFRSGTISLYDIVGRVLEKQSGTDRILIVVDQFEELYTLTSDEEVRRRFIDELLAASPRAKSKANVTLTLRGDFVGKALAYRPLSDRLQDAQINLGPMTREELEWAVRKPAERIQLEFEAGLVRRILDDVGDEPGNLPLLEFVLKELWDKRRGRILLNETYDAIGGLQGAVATKADELFKGFSSAEQKILQRIFLRIVRPSAESGLDTRRRAAFAELPPEGKELVIKLTDERLLVTNQSASGLGETVEVAHEALIANWSTLRAWVNEDREFLLWRDRLGPLVTEWVRAQENNEALLRGPLLMEAQKWFDHRSQDLTDQERKFISASREQRERLAREEKERQQRELAETEERRQEQAAAAKSLRRRAWVLAAVALGAVGAAIFGLWQMNEAETRRLGVQASEKKANDARDQADGLINFMLDDLRKELLPIGRLSILDAVVKQAKVYLDGLPKDLLTTRRLREQERLLRNLGDVFVLQGRVQEALSVYQHGLAIAKQVVNQEPSNAELKRDLSLSASKVGSVLEAQGKLQKALDAYMQSLDIRRLLADQDKSNEGWQRDLSVSYERIGKVLVAQGKLLAALGMYQQSLDIRRKLASKSNSNSDAQVDLSVSYEGVGDVFLEQGKLLEAMDAYQQELAIMQRLAEDKSNADWQRNLSVCQEKVGSVLIMQDKIVEAQQVYLQSLNIRRTLVEQDKSNAVWQRDLFVGYAKLAEVLNAQGKLPEAMEAYQQDRAIAERLSNQDTSNADWQRNLSVTYENLGDVLAEQGKLQEALEYYHQELAIAHSLADQDKANGSWQRDLSVCYEKVGDVLDRQGKFSEALEFYQQELAITRQLAEEDKSNADWQRVRIVSFYKVGVCMAEIGGRDNIHQAQGLLRTGLGLAGLYSGQDRQERINDFTLALAKLDR
jgi:tetratricopeptide (TPR) repeat protein